MNIFGKPPLKFSSNRLKKGTFGCMADDYKLSKKNIFGHTEKLDRLSKMIVENKFPHAIIFSGPEGIGKRKIAEFCAAALLCENPENGEPCGLCQNCKLAASHNHPDFYIVEPEATKTTRNIKIGQIRTMQAQTSLKPLIADRRVIIIDGAELMNNAAANSVLKTLEEPTGETTFILTSANRAGLLMTIRSRCVTMNFEKLPADQIKNALIQREFSPEESEKLSLISDGSFGRALSLAESGGYELRESALNFVERLCADEITNEDIFIKGAQVADWSRDKFSDFVVYIQKILRDIYLRDQSGLYNPDLKERLSKIKISERRLYAMIDEGIKIHRRIKSNANLRLLAEAYLMNMKRL